MSYNQTELSITKHNRGIHKCHEYEPPDKEPDNSGQEKEPEECMQELDTGLKAKKQNH